MRSAMLKFSGVLLVAMLPSLAAAEIYQCEENGRKIFSQEPCGADAKAVTLGSKGPSRITLPEHMDRPAALQLCKLMFNSWEMAAGLSKQGVSYERAQTRVFGYLRERIDNFDEITRKSPDAYSAMKMVSDLMTKVAYANPNALPNQRDAAVDQCATQTLDRFRQQGGGRASSMNM